MFRDRSEAGLLLAEKLVKYKDDKGVILAVPRGGVSVAYVVARELNLPADLILTKKIGHPLNKEYAIGSATLTDYFVIPHEDVTQDYIEKELRQVRSRLKEMYAKFIGDREPEQLAGKTVIVIDDGIATGNTLLGTIQMLRKSMPAKIVVAAPVASQSAVNKLEKEVDEVVVILIPQEFFGVGRFYKNFEEVSDEDVEYYMNKLYEIKKAG